MRKGKGFRIARSPERRNARAKRENLGNARGGWRGAAGKRRRNKEKTSERKAKLTFCRFLSRLVKGPGVCAAKSRHPSESGKSRDFVFFARVGSFGPAGCPGGGCPFFCKRTRIRTEATPCRRGAGNKCRSAPPGDRTLRRPPSGSSRAGGCALQSVFPPRVRGRSVRHGRVGRSCSR